MKKIVVGILAHADAGKTTLSESILYTAGNIRKMGRVDHGDSFLDTNELERLRGITIFSKQAVVKLLHTQITLVDTPGHVDFSAEMERTLQVLDAAILVISGADGVQGHTQTLWKLLKRYDIPVFLFVNKMDQKGTDKTELMRGLKARLNENCIDFTESKREVFCENAAVCSEQLLESFLEKGDIPEEELGEAILKRQMFPCYFGSALKNEGIEALIRDIELYTVMPFYTSEFGARVYKISRDEQGNRLTHMKITGGSLKTKELLNEEKVNQIRVYNGEKYEMVKEAEAGSICAVTGLTKTRPGDGLGAETEAQTPVLEPVLTYQIILPEDCDAAILLPKLRQLEEEEPELRITWNEKLQEIQAQLMGEVQIEVLKSMIAERFGVKVEFGSGNIVYKETIAGTVEGVGHFEPLRHYAEVHLLLEPGERGSGLVFSAECSEEQLAGNWQRLILTHLYEKEHIGVLTGSAITDMRITLMSGKAHLKHTEGGDFRQATYRAVRQGLMSAESVLLEPYYEFRLEIPEQMTGRAMADIERMSGKFHLPITENGLSILEGFAPVSEMQKYQQEVIAYSKGQGRLFLNLKGYDVCHNAEEIIQEIAYDAERDLDNPSGSVFCTHGAGFTVNWEQVPDYMHLESCLSLKEAEEAREAEAFAQTHNEEQWIGTEEVDHIIDRTFHANKKEKNAGKRWGTHKKTVSVGDAVYKAPKPVETKEQYLLVDGYNIIFAWQRLSELAETNMDGARGLLLDILCNYQAMKKCKLIVVFDAYRIQGHQTEFFDYHNIHVVYTKEKETADQYIEKFAHENSKKYQITVATSDGVEQVIIRGQGCSLLSAREFETEVREAEQQLRTEYLGKPALGKRYLFDELSEEIKGAIKEGE